MRDLTRPVVGPGAWMTRLCSATLTASAKLDALQSADADERRDDLRQALEIFGRAAAVRRVRTTVAELSAHVGGRLVGEHIRLWPAVTPLACARAAADLASAAAQLDHDGQAAARGRTWI